MGLSGLKLQAETWGPQATRHNRGRIQWRGEYSALSLELSYYLPIGSALVNSESWRIPKRSILSSLPSYLWLILQNLHKLNLLQMTGRTTIRTAICIASQPPGYHRSISPSTASACMKLALRGVTLEYVSRMLQAWINSRLPDESLLHGPSVVSWARLLHTLVYVFKFGAPFEMLVCIPQVAVLSFGGRFPRMVLRSIL